MEYINLISGRHILCTEKDNQPIYDSEGSLLVFDAIKGNIISVPISEESLAFFNLQVNADDEPKDFNFQSSSPSTSTQSSTQHASWKNDNIVRRLIYAWKEYESDFKSGKYKSVEVWKKIANVLQNENSEWLYTGVQCENKFKELRKKYVKIKDHNKQSGNSPMTCKFLNEFKEVLGDKPFVHPVALASNLKKRSLTSTSIDIDTTGMEDSKDESDIKNKVKKTKIQKELSAWSVALREDARQREESREQRHKELIAASDRATTVYKEMMEKLIDKL